MLSDECYPQVSQKSPRYMAEGPDGCWDGKIGPSEAKML